MGTKPANNILEEDEQFDGGSAFVHEPYVCGVCGGGFPYANSLAQCVDAVGAFPRLNKDEIADAKEMVKGIVEGIIKNFKNFMADEHTVQVTGS